MTRYITMSEESLTEIIRHGSLIVNYAKDQHTAIHEEAAEALDHLRRIRNQAEIEPAAPEPGATMTVAINEIVRMQEHIADLSGLQGRVATALIRVLLTTDDDGDPVFWEGNLYERYDKDMGRTILARIGQVSTAAGLDHQGHIVTNAWKRLELARKVSFHVQFSDKETCSETVREFRRLCSNLPDGCPAGRHRHILTRDGDGNPARHDPPYMEFVVPAILLNEFRSYLSGLATASVVSEKSFYDTDLLNDR